MKTLIVYYSFEGNTEYVARVLAEKIGADLLELRCGNEPSHGFMKYLIGGREALLGKKANLYKIEKNPEEYDLIIIGSPVWAGTMPPAVREFVKQHPFEKKRTAIFATSDSGNAENLLKKLRCMLAGNEVFAEMSVKKPLADKETAEEQVEEFIRKIDYGFDNSEDAAFGRADRTADQAIAEVSEDLAKMVASELKTRKKGTK